MDKIWDNIIVPATGFTLSITLSVGKTLSWEGAVASLVYGALGALGAVIINLIIKSNKKKGKNENL